MFKQKAYCLYMRRNKLYIRRQDIANVLVSCDSTRRFILQFHDNHIFVLCALEHCYPSSKILRTGILKNLPLLTRSQKHVVKLIFRYYSSTQ